MTDQIERLTSRNKAWLWASGPLYRDVEVVVEGEPWSTERDGQSGQFRRDPNEYPLNLLSLGSESMFWEAPCGSTVILKVRVK